MGSFCRIADLRKLFKNSPKQASVIRDKIAAAWGYLTHQHAGDQAVAVKWLVALLSCQWHQDRCLDTAIPGNHEFYSQLQGISKCNDRHKISSIA